MGRIASIRATLAIIQHDADTIIAQSRRALEYLDPDNLPIRTAATYTLGYAHQLQGDRAAASRAYTEVISLSTSFADSIYTIAATLGLGQVQEADNQLSWRRRPTRRVLELAGDPPRRLPPKRILAWRASATNGTTWMLPNSTAQQCLQLTRQMDSVDTFVSYAVFLARLGLLRETCPARSLVLDEAEAFLRQHNFVFRMRDIAAARVLIVAPAGSSGGRGSSWLRRTSCPSARRGSTWPRGDTTAALAVLEPWRRQVEAKGWADERLEVHDCSRRSRSRRMAIETTAVHVLLDALALAEPGGFVRSFRRRRHAHGSPVVRGRCSRAA